MLSIIYVGLIIVVFCVFPVMLTARVLGAEKSDLVDCIFAVIVGNILSSIIVPFIPVMPGITSGELMSYIYTFLVTGLVYKYMLQASYVASVVISLVSTLIAWGAAYVVVNMIA